MWMQRAGGIAAVLYGPCVMETEVAGTRVRILQETDYPFSLNVKFHLVLEGARSFPIAFRKPGWALSMHIGYKEVIADADGFVVIKQFWQNGDEISLTFTAEPRVREDSRGQSFVTYGPLVFALPLEGESIPGRHYGHEGFRNLKVAPAQDAGVRWQLPLNPALEVKDSGAVTSGWQRLEIQTNILNPASGVKHEVRLKPMGATILRKVCFEHEPVQNSPQLTA